MSSVTLPCVGRRWDSLWKNFVLANLLEVSFPTQYKTTNICHIRNVFPDIWSSCLLNTYTWALRLTWLRERFTLGSCQHSGMEPLQSWEWPLGAVLHGILISATSRLREHPRRGGGKKQELRDWGRMVIVKCCLLDRMWLLHSCTPNGMVVMCIGTSQSTSQLGWGGTHKAPPLAEEPLEEGCATSRLPMLWRMAPHQFTHRQH